MDGCPHDLEDIMLSEVSQTEKEKHYIISHTWNFKEGYKRTYLQNRNRIMDAENKLWLSGDGVGG